MKVTVVITAEVPDDAPLHPLDYMARVRSITDAYFDMLNVRIKDIRPEV